MVGVLHICRESSHQGLEDMVDKFGNQDGGARTGGDERSAWVLDLVKFGQQVKTRLARLFHNELFSLGR